MIVKINHTPKIGLLGFRQNLLAEVLNVFKYEYVSLESYTDIDETFDIVLMSGVHYIIPEEFISKTKYGIFGFHESPLPEGRGSAPIYWAVKNNRPNFTVSMFRANKYIDKGEIVTSINVPISKTDTYYSINEKRNDGIQQAMYVFLTELSEGVIVLRGQTGTGSYQKKRTPEDSWLDDSLSLRELWDDIRVCDNTNFPAYFTVDGTKVILRYEVVNDTV